MDVCGATACVLEVLAVAGIITDPQGRSTADVDDVANEEGVYQRD